MSVSRRPTRQDWCSCLLIRTGARVCQTGSDSTGNLFHWLHPLVYEPVSHNHYTGSQHSCRGHSIVIDKSEGDCPLGECLGKIGLLLSVMVTSLN